MDPITITVRDNGPFVIAGDDMARVRLVDAQGQTISTEGRKAIAAYEAMTPPDRLVSKSVSFVFFTRPCLVASTR